MSQFRENPHDRSSKRKREKEKGREKKREREKERVEKNVGLSPGDDNFAMMLQDSRYCYVNKDTARRVNVIRLSMIGFQVIP